MAAQLAEERTTTVEPSMGCCRAYMKSRRINQKHGAVCVVVAIRDRVFRLELTFSQSHTHSRYRTRTGWGHWLGCTPASELLPIPSSSHTLHPIDAPTTSTRSMAA